MTSPQPHRSLVTSCLAALMLIPVAVHAQPDAALGGRVVEVSGVDLGIHLCADALPGPQALIEILAATDDAPPAPLGVWRVTASTSCLLRVTAVCNTRMPSLGQSVLVITPARPAPPSWPSTAAAPGFDPQRQAVRQAAIATNIAGLESDDSRERRDAAKILYRHYRYEPTVQDAAERQLLAAHSLLVNDWNHVDGMAWLTNILGASGQPRFKSTLDLVASSTGSHKLRRYAVRNLRRLP